MRFVCAALALALGCSGPGPSGADRPQLRSRAVADYPALAFAPGDASYIVVASRLRDALSATRELVGAIGLVLDDDEVSLPGGLELERRMLDEGRLADLGFDLEGGVTVFSRGLYPTAVLHVADPERLDHELARLLPGDQTSVVRKAGHDLYTWDDEDRAISWIRWDDWFAVRRYDPRSDPELGAWFDRMLASGGGGDAMADAVAAARAALPREAAVADDPRIAPHRPAVHPGVVGLVRPSRITAAFPASQREPVAACTGLIGGDRVVLAADMSVGAGRGVVVASLSAADAADLKGAIGPALPAGVGRFLDDVHLGFELGVDPATAFGALSARCPWVHELSAREARLLGGGTLVRVAFGGRSLRLTDDRATIGVELVARSADFARELLDRIPARAHFEREVDIAGHKVIEVDVPLVPSFHYRLHHNRLVAGLGDGVMAQLVPEDRPASPGSAVVVRAWIEPPRVPDLARLLELAARAVGENGAGRAQRTAQRLRRYRRGAASLALDGPDLVLRLDMRSR